MPPLQDGRKFQFVVSTPSHDASRQKKIQRLVRKHVMRPFKKRAPRPSTFILEDEALVEYLAQRQRQRKSLVLYQAWLYCSPGLAVASAPASSSVFPLPPPRSASEEYGFVSTGSPSLAAALLGASRPNPFGRYPINMSTREHELVHHSKQLQLDVSSSLFIVLHFKTNIQHSMVVWPGHLSAVPGILVFARYG
jgi:hypothetical protein